MITIGGISFTKADRPPQLGGYGVTQVPVVSGGVDFVVVSSQIPEWKLTAEGPFAALPAVEGLVGTYAAIGGYGRAGTVFVVAAAITKVQAIYQSGPSGAKVWYVTAEFTLRTETMV
jgi:hypothetical protein